MDMILRTTYGDDLQTSHLPVFLYMREQDPSYRLAQQRFPPVDSPEDVHEEVHLIHYEFMILVW
jgi:hypothetical protein